MRGSRIVIPLLLLSLACTREAVPVQEEGVSFAFEEVSVQEWARTRAPGAGKVQELISDDGMTAFLLSEELGPMGPSTRAAAVGSIAGISDFNVTAFDHPGSFGASTVSVQDGKGFTDETFTVTSSGSNYWGVPSNTRYWPGSDRNLSFFVCSPAGAASIPQGMGYPSFSYTVPDNPAAQHDLLVASALNQVYTVTSQGTAGRAPLIFRHALAAVVFSIGDMGVNSDAGSLTVTLSGLSNHAVFAFDGATSSSSLGGTWGSPTGNGTFSFTTNLHGSNSSPVDYSSTQSGSNVLFMIPQVIANAAQLDMSYTDPGGTVHQFSVQLNTLGITAFVAGGLYKYTLSLSNKPSSLQVAYQRWKNSSDAWVSGPITQYEQGETFGVYAVDTQTMGATAKVVFANVPMTTASAAATSDLVTDRFLSSSYTYYIYYPYKAGLELTYEGSVITAGSVIRNPGNAFDFFEDYWTSFIPAVNQSTLQVFKASDLQVGAAASGGSGIARTVNMHHSMSLAKIVMHSATVDDTRVYNGNSGTTTREPSNQITVTPNPFSTASPNVVPWRNGNSDDHFYIAKYDSKPWVSDNKANDYGTWSVSPVILQNAAGEPIGQEHYYDGLVTVTSRAESRGWRYYEARYPYTGSAMTFTAPVNGYYKFECWGAEGGGNAGTNYGKGAYTKGNLPVTTSQTFYVYVGQSGGSERGTSRTKTFNGGGAGKLNGGYQDYRGGGATDIRTNNGGGAWNNATGLNSRIMVAAGGGGHSHGAHGGYGGGLEGWKGVTFRSLEYEMQVYKGPERPGGGGTQTAGGAAGAGTGTTDTGVAGTFGIGGNSRDAGYGGGGGGGYYGGGGEGPVISLYMGGGGGGSSYISGHEGCTRNDNYRFSSTSMIAGGAFTVGAQKSITLTYEGTSTTYQYYPVTPVAVNQPQPDGTTTTYGHSGNGYARITYVKTYEP